MTERNEISAHEIAVFKALGPEWATSTEVHAMTTGVAPRTVRAHLHRLVLLGIADQAKVFPAHHYRLSEFAEKRNLAYLTRLRNAAIVFAKHD